ncbi:alanine dehydrogenase [Bacteroidota bacterium]
MAEKEGTGTSVVLKEGGLLPQEEMLEIGKTKKKLFIGIPKENHKIENRVALTPEAVEVLAQEGHTILVESGCGKQASYSDMDYSEFGAKITNVRKEIFQSDIVLKVAPMSYEEISYLKGHQLIISSLHYNDKLSGYINKLVDKKVTAIAFENLKGDEDFYPIDRSMAEISGSSSIFIAAEYLSNVHKGKGVFLGGITGITPTEVVILGAGTAGEYAARAALGVGANVKVFDDSIIKLRRIQNNLGQRVFTSVFHKKVLEKVLISADVVIGTLNYKDQRNQFIISESMIKKMKEGAMIIDINIDKGGAFETSECRTHENPVYKRHGVLHYCIPNIPSRFARTASIALSNVFVPLLINIGEFGQLKNLLKEDLGVRHSVYIYNGMLTNYHIGEILGIPSKEIELLMAAF